MQRASRCVGSQRGKVVLGTQANKLASATPEVIPLAAVTAGRCRLWLLLNSGPSTTSAAFFARSLGRCRICWTAKLCHE